MGRPRKLDAERSFVFKDKEYLNPAKRAELENKLKALERNARNIDNVIDPGKPWLYNPKSTNVADLYREMGKVKKTLARRTPRESDAKTRNVLFARAKGLEREIQKEMPSKSEMQGKRYVGGNGKPYVVASEEAIRKQMDWQVRQAGNVREWQQIMRVLDPADPNAANVERLRRAR